jgi:RNA polymerase sigma-70 factor (ECF subfamily)
MRESEAASETATVEEWIGEARQGSRAALNQLFGACLPYLLVAAHQDLNAALRSRIDAADLVQETLIEAYRDFPHFQGRSKKHLLAWVRQILHHNLANERRRHLTSAMRSVHCEVFLSETALNQLRDEAQSDRQSPAEQLEAQERTEALERALRKLPQHYQQVLFLRTWKELTYAQIGNRLQCSAEAARKLWRRATEELASILGAAQLIPGKG